MGTCIVTPQAYRSSTVSEMRDDLARSINFSNRGAWNALVEKIGRTRPYGFNDEECARRNSRTEAVRAGDNGYKDEYTSVGALLAAKWATLLAERSDELGKIIEIREACELGLIGDFYYKTEADGPYINFKRFSDLREDALRWVRSENIMTLGEEHLVVAASIISEVAMDGDKIAFTEVWGSKAFDSALLRAPIWASWRSEQTQTGNAPLFKPYETPANDYNLYFRESALRDTDFNPYPGPFRLDTWVYKQNGQLPSGSCPNQS